MRLFKHQYAIGYISACVLGAGLLTGCGFKGPLYLPPPPNTIGDQPPAESNAPQIPAQTNTYSPTYSPFYQPNPSLEPAPRAIQ